MNYTPTPITRADRGGFTLLEVMIVVAIIGLLCAIAIPGISHARTRSFDTYLTEEIKDTEQAFEMYEADHAGQLPMQAPGVATAISTAGVVPPGMGVYMPKNSHWTTGTYGSWLFIYWPGLNPGYAGLIYLYNPQLTPSDISFFDQKLDDGNPNTGAIINYGPGTMTDFIQ